MKQSVMSKVLLFLGISAVAVFGAWWLGGQAGQEANLAPLAWRGLDEQSNEHYRARFNSLEQSLRKDSSFPAFTIGETISARVLGFESEFHELNSMNKGFLVVFTGSPCDKCDLLQHNWNELQGQIIASQRHVIICSKDVTSSLADYGVKVMTSPHSFDFVKRTWNLHYLPTLVSVSGAGVVEYIQFGFEGEFEVPLLAGLTSN